MLKFFCSLLGHFPRGPVHPVYTNVSVEPYWEPKPHADGSISCQGIGYYMRECRVCGYRVPIDETNAHRKAQVIASIAAVMNRSRAEYGLPPISWDR